MKDRDDEGCCGNPRGDGDDYRILNQSEQQAGAGSFETMLEPLLNVWLESWDISDESERRQE